MANFNFNKAIIGGRLTSDVELKSTPSGVAVASFTVAVNRRGKSDVTDFFKVTAWRGTAEFISQYFRKGSSISIVGELQNRTWEDNNGNKRYITEIVATEVQFVDSKSDSPAQNGGVPMPNYTNSPDPNFEELGEDDTLPF